MPLERRVCPAVGVITEISAVATDRNTIHLLATTVRSSAFFDMDQAAATALRPDATVDDRIVTWRETACGDMIGLLRVHVLNFNSQPRGLIILRLQLQMHFVGVDIGRIYAVRLVVALIRSDGVVAHIS